MQIFLLINMYILLFQGRKFKGKSSGSSLDLQENSLPQNNDFYIPYTGINMYHYDEPRNTNHSSFRPQESLSNQTPHNPYLYNSNNTVPVKNNNHKRFNHLDRYPHRPYYSNANINSRSSEIVHGGWRNSAPVLYTGRSRPRVT